MRETHYKNIKINKIDSCAALNQSEYLMHGHLKFHRIVIMSHFTKATNFNEEKVLNEVK